VAGAREPAPAEGPSILPSPAPVAGGAAARGPRTAAWYASGAVALASLAGLLVFPLRVFAAGADGWEARLASFHTAALVLTVVYFVAGVAWMNANEARRGGGAR